MAGYTATAKTADWTTDQDTVDRITRVFGGFIELDPCSNEQSIVNAGRSYSLPTVNGLVTPWIAKTIYCNPPFGRAYLHAACNALCAVERVPKAPGSEKMVAQFVCTVCNAVLTRKQVKGSSIADWVARCEMASVSQHNDGVIGLMPAAISTKHFHRDVWPCAAAVFFPCGRLNFGGEANGGAPMDTVLVLWGEKHADAFEDTFRDIGFVSRLDVQRAKRKRMAPEPLTIRQHITKMFGKSA